MTIYPHHHDAWGRHEERVSRGLASFAAREGKTRRLRLSRAHCPLSLLAGRIAARRRARPEVHAAA